MKIFFTLIIATGLATTCIAQDFAKAIATAKTAYGAGKLEDAHFALQQALQEVDLTIGKEVLLLLPSKIDILETVSKDDNVSSNIGFVGATIHRAYGKTGRKADISIISNSPLVAMINTTLNTPMLGGMLSGGNIKTVKIQGYKAQLEKQPGSTSDKNSYQLQIPIGSALITFKVDDCTDSDILQYADTIPLLKIAKLID